jgi:ribosomal protein L28
MAKSKGGVGQKITGNKLRRFNPNLQKINTVQETGNKRVLVCTKCIKAGKIRKP